MTRLGTPAAIAEARRVVKAAEEAMALQPSGHLLPIEEQRAGMANAGEPEREDAVIDEIAGVPVRILEPDNVEGTYLHLHGGGWTMGSPSITDQRLWRIATEVGVRVISVDYRLAPEHPFPACIDDCVAVATELVGRGRKLLIGGESAGAHLSALTLTRVREGFLGANLVYGCYDLGMSPSQRAWGDRRLVLSTPIIAWHLDQLLPGVDEAGRRDPSVSPLYADLDGLPPALLTVGSEDPMLDDSVLLHERWPGSVLQVWESGFHGFDLFPLALAEQSRREQIAFLRTCLAPRPSASARRGP